MPQRLPGITRNQCNQWKRETERKNEVVESGTFLNCDIKQT